MLQIPPHFSYWHWLVAQNEIPVAPSVLRSDFNAIGFFGDTYLIYMVALFRRRSLIGSAMAQRMQGSAEYQMGEKPLEVKLLFDWLADRGC